MKKIKYIFIVCIVLIIIIPLVFFNHKKEVASSLDNRMLTTLDVIDAENVENYISDRIGFREEMINVYNTVNRDLFNVISGADLMVGLNGEDIYPKISSIETYNQYHEMFLNSVKRIQDYCEARNIKFYFILEPSKTSIINDNLPLGLNYNTDWIDEFVIRANEKGINFVDNYTYFNSIKNDILLYNKTYDTYHWNDTGAFYGINNLLSSMGLKENDLADYDVILKKYDENGAKIDDTVFELVPKIEAKDLSQKYANGLLMQDDFKEFRYYESDNGNLSLLSFQGSYFMTEDRTSKFLANNFSKTIGVHNYQNIFNINYYLNIYRPDIVIFEVADYTFGEYYFAQYFMETMITPPTLASLNGLNENSYDVGIEYRTELDGEYLTYIFSNAGNKYTYGYLCVDDLIYDLRKYDNENMALTILKDDDFDIENVIIKYVDIDNNSIDVYSLK